MTPQEKAKDLFVKYYERLPDDTYSNESAKSEAKQYALIALRETVWGYLDQQPIEVQNYWQEVKREIEKI